jgi:hypothetical protein
MEETIAVVFVPSLLLLLLEETVCRCKRNVFSITQVVLVPITFGILLIGNTIISQIHLVYYYCAPLFFQKFPRFLDYKIRSVFFCHLEMGKLAMTNSTLWLTVFFKDFYTFGF